jgi:hypothetical protein
MRGWILVGLAVVVGASAVRAGEAPPLINPVGTEKAKDDGSDAILDALHKRGIGLNDFTADVSMAEVDPLTGDTDTLSGKVWYQNKADGSTRLRIIFDKKVQGGRPVKDFKQEYQLEGRWLIERNHKRKLQVDRQVLKPGQQVNLLKLGEGPFPLPVGQPKEEVRKQFEVKKIAPAEGDPAGTQRVELVPAKGTQFERKFKKIDVWVEDKSNFPRRIGTVEKNTTQKVTDLTNIKVNEGLDQKVFELGEVPKGWDHKSEAMDD